MIFALAGNQNSGMVFFMTMPHCALQSIDFRYSVIFIGFSSPITVPPLRSMCMSVHLWKVIITGAKIVFISTLTQKAMPSFPHENDDSANIAASDPLSHPPSISRNLGTPVLNITIAIAMHIPRNPHTIIRGTTPNPFS